MFAPNFAESLADQWSRGPRVFRNALLRPVFDGADFMTVMRGAAREYVADPNARVPPARVYLKSEMAPPEHRAPFIPRGGETCEQYVGRLVQTFPTVPFGIVIDNCEKHFTPMRDALVPLLHHLFQTAHYPARRNHLCVYSGNYRSTPFGIHRDECHVIMFCGVGKKSMAFWPPTYFDDKPKVVAGGKVKAPVQDFIADATVLEIGPLDALYWSDADWHVAVADTDDFQAALSVGIYHHGTSSELIGGLDFVAASTKHPGRLDVEGLPVPTDGVLSNDTLRTTQMAGFFDRWAALRERLSAPGEDDYRALDFALRIMSSAGYGRLRQGNPPVPTNLESAVVQCPVAKSLVLSHARGGVMVGANGSAFFYDTSVPLVEALVLGLRDGVARPVADLLAASGPDAGGLVMGVLRDLVGAGALTVRSAA